MDDIKPAEYITYDLAKKQVETEYKKILLSAPRIIRVQTEHLAKSSGKFIRADSCLICAENNNGLIHQDAAAAATAIELFHLATLVHDDVIDDAKTRRGIESLQTKFGRRTAVICGDYLFCLSLKTASSVSRREKYLNFNFSDYISRICLGEMMQGINNKNYDLSFYNYLKIISGKTAALFEASFQAGALLNDDSGDDVRLYSQLGKYIGMIFQLNDDCIDYESSQEQAKKPVLSDYEQGVITLPLIYTLEKNEELRTRVKASHVPKEEINAAVTAAGGTAFARKIARRYYKKAVNIINRLNTRDEKKDRLNALLNKAYNELRCT